MTIYAIMGVTGQVGGSIARKLLADGAQVRAIVRNPQAATAWLAQGASAAAADLNDAAAMERAFAGTDGVFVMTPTWFAADDMFAENLAAIDTLGTALRAARPRKVVLLSSVGAQLDAGTGAIGKLQLMELALSDLPALTSIRAAWFMENYVGLVESVRTSGALPSMLAPLDQAIPMVATADIGALAAQRLQADWDGQHVIELEGPRRYSPHDVAAAFATVLGRAVTAHAVPPSEWNGVFQSWGLSLGASKAMVAMIAGFNNGHIRFSHKPELVRKAATTLESVLAALASH